MKNTLKNSMKQTPEHFRCVIQSAVKEAEAHTPATQEGLSKSWRIIDCRQKSVLPLC